jgi:hypothetical protein
VPGVDPKTAPQIPFESPVILFAGPGATNPIFNGRRINRPGTAIPGKTSVSYIFGDAWYDFDHITFKQLSTYISDIAWPDCVLFQENTLGAYLGGYVKTSDQLIRALNFAIGAGVNIQIGAIDLCCAQPAASGNVPAVGATFVQPTPTAAANLATATTAMNAAYIVLNAAMAAYMNSSDSPAFLGAFTAAQAAFNVANAAYIAAINAGGLGYWNQTPPYGYYVPFFPSRCMKIAAVIKQCLKVHPDCFTEIDYTTTPPTFNVRRRSALFDGTVTPAMAAVTVPYKWTDANGNAHTATDIQDLPELQPKRMAIFYQIVGRSSAGPSLTLLVDGYGGSPPGPINSTAQLAATDGLRAMDYSANLAGATTKTTTAVLNTLPFDPSTLALWLLKCQPLNSPKLCNPSVAPLGTSTVAFANPSNIRVNGLAWGGTGFEGWFYFDSGTCAPWMGVGNLVTVNVSADFTYQTFFPDSTLAVPHVKGKAQAHTHHFRIKLINYNSVADGNSFSTTQQLSAGQMVPFGLAQGLFNVLQPLQYKLSHKLIATGAFAGFLKPGKHCINLAVNPADVVSGDQSAAWGVMNASLQQSVYTVHADGAGNGWMDIELKCGPVKSLEPGEFIQLRNLFTNRHTAEYDMHARVGQGDAGVTNLPTDTEKENSTSSTADQSSATFFVPKTDGSGNADPTQGQIQFNVADLAGIPT